MRLPLALSACLVATGAFAETWECTHRDPSREPLTFEVGTTEVQWTHARLGKMDPLALIVQNKAMLTMGTQRVNILYSRFFHLDKLSGRMGDVTFRPEFLRKLERSPQDIRPDQFTTVWMCTRQEELSSPNASK